MIGGFRRAEIPGLRYAYRGDGADRRAAEAP